MLYLITNRKIAPERSFYKVIAEAIAGGVDGIILREKDLTTEELLSIAKKIKQLIDSKKIALIINSNLTVAQAVNADGYHIGFEQLVKERPSWSGLLGVSVHNLEEAILAEKYGAHYLLASHIYPTACKEKLEPKGVTFIQNIKNHVKTPVIALGGISPHNTQAVMAAGAQGIAVMSYIMQADNPLEATKKLKEQLRFIKS